MTSHVATLRPLVRPIAGGKLGRPFTHASSAGERGRPGAAAAGGVDVGFGGELDRCGVACSTPGSNSIAVATFEKESG
jgi:hypothetical protein